MDSPRNGDKRDGRARGNERAEKVWRRRRDRGGVLMGLCAGLGAHLGIDPVVIRLGLVLLTCLHYAGLAVILVYVLFSLFIAYEPEEA